MVKCINFHMYLSYFSELLGLLAWLSNTQQVAHTPLGWVPYFQPFPHPSCTLENNKLVVMGDKAQNERVKRLV